MMIIIAKLLRNNKYIIKFINYISPFFMRIFGFETSEEVFIFIFSFLSGNPTSHILINDLFNENKISKAEANRLSISLCFSSFLYLYKTSIILFKDSIGIILFINYLIPILLLIKPTKQAKIKINPASYSNNINLNKIVNEAFMSLIKIFSFVFFFDIITSFLVSFFKLPASFSYLLANSLDMTVSTRYYYSYSKNLNLFIYCFFNAFLGISIHMQIMSVASYLSYKVFLINRVLIGLISGIIAIIFSYNLALGALSSLFFSLIIFKKRITKKMIPNFEI